MRLKPHAHKYALMRHPIKNSRVRAWKQQGVLLSDEDLIKVAHYDFDFRIKLSEFKSVLIGAKYNEVKAWIDMIDTFFLNSLKNHNK